MSLEKYLLLLFSNLGYFLSIGMPEKATKILFSYNRDGVDSHFPGL